MTQEENASREPDASDIVLVIILDGSRLGANNDVEVMKVPKARQISFYNEKRDPSLTTR